MGVKTNNSRYVIINGHVVYYDCLKSGVVAMNCAVEENIQTFRIFCQTSFVEITTRGDGLKLGRPASWRLVVGRTHSADPQKDKRLKRTKKFCATAIWIH
jgi:hypothetical protein